MHLRLLVFIGFAGLLFASPAALAADAGCCNQAAACCDKADKAACPQAGGCDMPCCKHAGHEASPVDTVLDMELPPAEPMAPARQAVSVWFHRPVRVGAQILLGRYVVEHDNDRMARGEPCTHIYAYDDQKTPVVAFHCTHLERDLAKDHRIVLRSTGDIMQTFVEFQFAGEAAGHGFPTVR